MLNWWIYSEKENHKYVQNYISQSHLVHNKTHTDTSGVETAHTRREAENGQSQTRHCLYGTNYAANARYFS